MSPADRSALRRPIGTRGARQPPERGRSAALGSCERAPQRSRCRRRRSPPRRRWPRTRQQLSCQALAVDICRPCWRDGSSILRAGQASCNLQEDTAAPRTMQNAGALLHGARPSKFVSRENHGTQRASRGTWRSHSAHGRRPTRRCPAGTDFHLRLLAGGRIGIGAFVAASGIGAPCHPGRRRQAGRRAPGSEPSVGIG